MNQFEIPNEDEWLDYRDFLPQDVVDEIWYGQSHVANLQRWQECLERHAPLCLVTQSAIVEELLTVRLLRGTRHMIELLRTCLVDMGFQPLSGHWNPLAMAVIERKHDWAELIEAHHLPKHQLLPKQLCCSYDMLFFQVGLVTDEELWIAAVDSTLRALSPTVSRQCARAVCDTVVSKLGVSDRIDVVVCKRIFDWILDDWSCRRVFWEQDSFALLWIHARCYGADGEWQRRLDEWPNRMRDRRNILFWRLASRVHRAERFR